MTCPARPAWPAYLGRHGQTRKTPACLPRPWRPILCALVLHHNITQPNPTPDGLLCRSRFTTAHNNGAGREKKPRKYPKIKQRPSLATAHFPSHTELPYSNGPAHFALLQAAEPRTVVLPIRNLDNHVVRCAKMRTTRTLTLPWLSNEFLMFRTRLMCCLRSETRIPPRTQKRRDPQLEAMAFPAPMKSGTLCISNLRSSPTPSMRHSEGLTWDATYFDRPGSFSKLQDIMSSDLKCIKTPP
ncbi:hypothetical protein F5B18DRAFT_344731 [Nemania serpens]|nr:hypothetical protein F5B18DRAFT_344731 [Nemania serpens]